MKRKLSICVFVVIFLVFGSSWAKELRVGTAEECKAALTAQGNGEAPLTKLWEDSYSTGFNLLMDLAIDSNDNIIVTGWDSYAGIDTIKYDSNGTALWAKSDSSVSSAWTVTVDSSDNIIVGATKSGNFCIIKYSPGGEIIWTQTYDSGIYDGVRSVACDKDGNIIVFGEKYTTPYSPDWEVVKYDKHGKQLWVRTFDSGRNDYPEAVAVDSKNNIILVGYSYYYSPSNTDIVIKKYDPDGNPFYHEVYDSGNYDYANAVCVDNDDNIIVAGSRRDGEGNDHLYVRKYNSDIDLLWDAEESDVISKAYIVAISTTERILAGGMVEGTEEEKGKNYIVCYDISGNKLWNFTYNPTEFNDEIYGLAIDSHNNVAVGSTAGATYLTEKYGYCYIGIEDIMVKEGEEVVVPIMVNNSPRVAACGVKLSYDPETVLVTDAAEGDFTSFFGFNDLHAGDGWVTINTYITCTDLSGDLVVANVTLKAVGEVEDSSPLNLDIIALANQYGYNVPADTDDGIFTIQPLPCEWNFDEDRDVDGSDLAVFAAGYAASYDKDDLSAFAADFGRTNCPD